MKDYSFIAGSIDPVVDGDILWAISYHTNIILKIDLNRKELIGAYPVPGGNVGIVEGHAGIKKWGSTIYIFPNKGKDIYCFDTENLEFERIILKDNVHIVVSAVYEQFIYFVDINGKGIFCLNCENRIINKKVFTDQEIELYGLGKEGRVDFVRSCQKKDKLYITLFSRDAVLVLDLLNNLYEFVTLPYDGNIELGSIDQFQEGFILSTMNEEIIIWEPNTINRIECLHFIKGDFRKQQRDYLKIFSDGKDLVLIASWERKIIVKKNNEFTNIDFDYFLSPQYIEYRTRQFMMTFEYNGKYYVQAMSNGQLYCVDVVEKEIKNLEIFVPDSIRKKAVKVIMYNNKSVLAENGIITLNDYIEFFGVSNHEKGNNT